MPPRVLWSVEATGARWPASCRLDILQDLGRVQIEGADGPPGRLDRDGLVEARIVPGGERVPTLVCYWFAWVEFDPETDLVEPR